MENKILTELPRYNDGCNKGKTNWNEVKNLHIDVIYDNEIYDILLEKYVGGKVKCVYGDKIMYMARSSVRACTFGELLGKINHGFLYKIGDTVNNLVITEVGYTYRKSGKRKNERIKAYKFKCINCKYDSREYYSTKDEKYYDEYWITEDYLKQGYKCPCCRKSPQIIVKGINDMWTTTPELAKLLTNPNEGYIITKSSNKFVSITCPICGKEMMKNINNIYNNKSIGCNKCSDGISYGEKFMYNLLNQLNVIFETEYSPEYLNGKRSDFFYSGL